MELVLALSTTQHFCCCFVVKSLFNCSRLMFGWCIFGAHHRRLISGVALNSIPFFIFWSHSSHLPRDWWKREEHFHQTDEDHSWQRVQWSWEERFHSAGVSEHLHSHPGSDPSHEDSTDWLHRWPEHSEKIMCFKHDKIDFFSLHWLVNKTLQPY